MRSDRVRRIAAALLAVGVIAAAHRPILHALAPAIEGALGIVQPRLQLQGLAIEPHAMGERMVARFVIARPIAIGAGALLVPNRDALIAAHVAAPGVLLLPIVALAIALLAVARSVRERIAILALAAAGAFVITAIDAAAALAGAAWGVLRAAHPELPASRAESVALFMTLGGRVAIGIAWGVLCVRAGRWLEEGWPD